MTSHLSPVLDDRWFRGVIHGVVVGDLWAAEVGGAQPSEDKDSWRSQFLEMVKAEAGGQVTPACSGGEMFVQMAQRSQPGLLLLVLPVLLVQANPYGHRSYPWQSWIAGLGLPDQDLAMIDQTFQMVCSAMAGRPSGLWRAQDGALIATIQGLLKASQGEFPLAIRLARQQGGDPLLVSWLGAVTLIQGGWTVLPSSLCHRCLESVALGQRWGNLDQRGINQLALNLYDRWRGRRPGLFPQDRFSV